uniref:DUF1538 domain-containing protein n=1 Tax=Candidatus Kentrum sp. TUN TaxID=2126343 RepID=A0A451AHI1_9GAMM|nr:MAG: Protein of unknown function (DUF1538) [Candidatus Kentron sp. TUN]VFK56243.1 MAG: Protein of unknown function (DUF1538) [Candidatus Kentron sp. TUN]VFK65498.1 MAG: Protein of unknown function (DUF1538) [Candidatus Kentron sp. TUN]
MNILYKLIDTLLVTIWDVLPILLIVFGFQFLVLRRAIPNLAQVSTGFIFVLLGLAFFIEGLELALFPLGKMMAGQLTDPAFISASVTESGELLRWQDYYWVYIFGAAIGFATTIAEPSLIAVAIKARDVSSGAISIWGLRIAVAIGVAIGIGLGTYRIVTGTPLYYYIIAGYVFVILQTMLAPRMIIALAYDSGGVTTSTVTVPLVTALGLGLASTVPGRSPVLDGFGLIAFASLFPIIAVLGYVQITQYLRKRKLGNTPKSRE